MEKKTLIIIQCLDWYDGPLSYLCLDARTFEYVLAVTVDMSETFICSPIDFETLQKWINFSAGGLSYEDIFHNSLHKPYWKFDSMTWKTEKMYGHTIDRLIVDIIPLTEEDYSSEKFYLNGSIN